MSKEHPSGNQPEGEDLATVFSPNSKVRRFRGEDKDLSSKFKNAEKQNREKFKEFQERFAVLKGKLPKSERGSEESTLEVTKVAEETLTAQRTIQIQEAKPFHAIATTSTDESDNVAKILRDRDECSQKTKVALEVLEEKKHQFMEYQNLIAKAQKDFEKADISKSEGYKSPLEPIHLPVDSEKEMLQKDVEDKSKVIRSLQLKIEKLTHANEEFKLTKINTVSPTENTIDNSNFISELESKNEKIEFLKETINSLTDDKLTLEERNSSKEKEITKLHLVLETCIEKIINIGNILQISNDNETFNFEKLESKISAIEIEIITLQNVNRDLESRSTKDKDSSSSTPTKENLQKVPKRSKSQQRGKNTKPKSPWASVTPTKQDCLKASKDFKPIKTEESSSSTMCRNVDLENSLSELNQKMSAYESTISERDQQISYIEKVLTEKEDEIKQLTAKYDEIYKDSQNKALASGKITVESEINVESGPGDLWQVEPLTGSDKNIIDESVEVNIELLELKLEESQKQIEDLSKQLDDANKNMIKTKASHKSKIKQMQKTIDSFSKMSDANSEVIRLNNEVAALIQKVAELEEDKGNLQLHLVDYDSVKVSDQGEAVTANELEQIAEARLKAISELEMQKFDLVQELHATNQKTLKLEEKIDELSQLENDHVSSQINSVQLEEQLDKFSIECKSLSNQLNEMQTKNNDLSDNIQKLIEEKEDLAHKLESYMKENIVLTEKLEKLSAEKVSSAESIEIVESLTIQEKLEIEQFNEGITNAGTTVPLPTNDYLSPELNEDILKLSQDSVELHNKIELFTQERREVMEKMDLLRNENLILTNNIEELISVKLQLETELEALKVETVTLRDTIVALDLENKAIKAQTAIVLSDKISLELKVRDLGAEINTEKEKYLKTEAVPVTPNTERIVASINSETQVDIINAETYDANAKSIKKLTKEILKLKNSIKEKNIETDKFEIQLQSIKEELNNIKTENISIKEEKDAINYKLASLLETNNNLSIENKNLIEEKSTYLDIQKINDQLDDQLKMKEISIVELRFFISQLEAEVSNLNELLKIENVKSNGLSAEVTEVKNTILELNKDLTHKEELLESLRHKLQISEQSNTTASDKLKVVENELLSLNHALDENENEINNLIKERDFNSKELNRLQHECRIKDDALKEISLKFSAQSEEIKQFSITMPNLNEIRSSYEEKINMLQENNQQITEQFNKIAEKYSTSEIKNKELLEKLKKFAFNLKKKHTTCTELEVKVQELTAQLENEFTAAAKANITIENLQREISSLTLKCTEIELNAQQTEIDIDRIAVLQKEKLELEKVVESMISESNDMKLKFDISVNQIDKLRIENETLNTQINNELIHIEELRSENEILNKIKHESSLQLSSKLESLENDMASKKTEIKNLLDNIANVQSAYDSFKFGHDAKLQERDLYIETLENDILKYKDRVVKLEESISAMEERRFSLERNASQLGFQIQELIEKQKSVSEHAQYEDALEQRMAALIAHDEVIEKQLEDSRAEIDQLHAKIRMMLHVNQQQTEELSNIQNMAEKQRQEMSNISILEEEKQLLSVELDKAQNELKKNTILFENLLKERKEEFDSLEYDLQLELEKMTSEKKNLFEEFEKSLEVVSALQYQLEDERQKHNWLKSEYDILLMNFTDAKVFKENSDQYERKYKEACNKVANLEAIMTERDSQINKGITLPTEISKPINTDDISDKKVSLSDYFSAPSELSFDILDQIISPQEIECNTQALPNIDHCTQTSYKVVNLASPQSSDVASSLKVEVKEDVIIPKKSYSCEINNPPLEVSNEAQAFDDFETNWGEDAHLEEQHYQVQALAFQSSDDFKKLNQQIDYLTKENEKLINELSETNVKLSKALKKLKETKILNDGLESKLKSLGENRASDLDLAIQDELLSQVKNLEEIINTMGSQFSKSQIEKDSLNKQIDVLTVGNERLVEAKEAMDYEIAMWKQRHKELSNRLSQFESFTEVPSSSNLKASSTSKVLENRTEIQELMTTVNDLTADNDELQVLLEELRHGKNELEKQLARQTTHTISESDDIKVLRSQNEHFSKNITVLESKIVYLQNHIDESDKIISSLKKQYDESEANRIAAETMANECSKTVEQLNHSNTELLLRLETASKENINLIQGLQKIENENRSLFEKISILQNDFQSLTNEKERLEYSIQRGYSEDISKILQDKEVINSQLNILNEQHQHLLKNYNDLQENLVRLSNDKSEVEIVLQKERDDLLSKINDSMKDLTEMRDKVYLFKQENDILREKCVTAQQEKDSLLESYNISLEATEKIRKSNLSLQEEYSTLKSDLNNAILKIELLQNQEALLLQRLNEHEEFSTEFKKPVEDQQEVIVPHDELNQRLNEYEILLNEKENKLKLSLICIDDLNTNLSRKERDIEEYANRYSILEKKMSEAVFEKDAEIAEMRLKAYDGKIQSDAEYDKLQKERDNIEIILNNKISDMKTAMESQEIEIVSLKETLANTQITLTPSKDIIESKLSAIARNSNSNTPELDFALYLLHQRTVKCEELTHELSSLLEERDTLQLRLSDALRLNESMRSRYSPAASEVKPENIGEIPSNISGSSDIDSSPSDELKNKLTELKTVRYQKDVRLRDEQEQRHRELELMQNDIANLPEEAAIKLRDAHYTLNRNTQSTSEVFMNWLLGKSTPKIVHDM